MGEVAYSVSRCERDAVRRKCRTDIPPCFEVCPVGDAYLNSGRQNSNSDTGGVLF